MTPDPISSDLKTVLRRLKLSRILDTLPERLVLARQQKMPHQDLLLLVLQDETSRRDSLAVSLRAQRGHLEPQAQLENWDEAAKVSFERALLGELASLRFVESHQTLTGCGKRGRLRSPASTHPPTASHEPLENRSTDAGFPQASTGRASAVSQRPTTTAIRGGLL